jgi:hypothetical protein
VPMCTTHVYICIDRHTYICIDLISCKRKQQNTMCQNDLVS